MSSFILIVFVILLSLGGTLLSGFYLHSLLKSYVSSEYKSVTGEWEEIRNASENAAVNAMRAVNTTYQLVSSEKAKAAQNPTSPITTAAPPQPAEPENPPTEYIDGVIEISDDDDDSSYEELSESDSESDSEESSICDSEESQMEELQSVRSELEVSVEFPTETSSIDLPEMELEPGEIAEPEETQVAQELVVSAAATMIESTIPEPTSFDDEVDDDGDEGDDSDTESEKEFAMMEENKEPAGFNIGAIPANPTAYLLRKLPMSALRTLVAERHPEMQDIQKLKRPELQRLARG